ncbi:MAG: hypothetical protein GF355_01655 [Candidatus Eisenbacteria bacterium]|nr:hypothetical protein [Candidatus Eisenbacteria bacterium]
MARRYRARLPDSFTHEDRAAEIEAALAAMSAENLRELVRDMLLELDEPAKGRIMNSLIDRATRNASGWTPAGPSNDDVSEILSFAEAAR